VDDGELEVEMADYGADEWRWEHGVLKGHEDEKLPPKKAAMAGATPVTPRKGKIGFIVDDEGTILWHDAGVPLDREKFAHLYAALMAQEGEVTTPEKLQEFLELAGPAPEVENVRSVTQSTSIRQHFAVIRKHVPKECDPESGVPYRHQSADSVDFIEAELEEAQYYRLENERIRNKAVEKMLEAEAERDAAREDGRRWQEALGTHTRLEAKLRDERDAARAELVVRREAEQKALRERDALHSVLKLNGTQMARQLIETQKNERRLFEERDALKRKLQVMENERCREGRCGHYHQDRT
jgi:hypothetical protein